ncbi:MAG: RNA 2',3'-cyclic phosphodiesterase [Nitrosomonas sp.]|uniref:RNA 2',3'-cyclic phosphodiesterase n=1 Tax=Nitrosomonas sp. TaxID=42353 RepID=UPI0025FDCF85|nr:RNA 2',3'-cyclic phosphodiesterase [Nitrosomonas sp.]MBY0474768.1 RNA 2',3'-cyclic phosphodiesterase [Nitrosomonas sp.]
MTKNNEIERKSIRVFFAILPNKQIQKQLMYHSETLEPICGGRKVKMQHIHLTLLFLGNVETHRIQTLQQIAENIPAKKFEFKLDTIGYWRHNHIVYIQAKKFPVELFSLADSLKIALSKGGFAFDNRTYKPHITIFRKAIHHVSTDLINPIRWCVNQWLLVQSKPTHSGVEYIPLSYWRLK